LETPTKESRCQHKDEQIEAHNSGAGVDAVGCPGGAEAKPDKAYKIEELVRIYRIGMRASTVAGGGRGGMTMAGSRAAARVYGLRLCDEDATVHPEGFTGPGGRCGVSAAARVYGLRLCDEDATVHPEGFTEPGGRCWASAEARVNALGLRDEDATVHPEGFTEPGGGSVPAARPRMKTPANVPKLHEE
jgi:hypothetical protein